MTGLYWVWGQYRAYLALLFVPVIGLRLTPGPAESKATLPGR